MTCIVGVVHKGRVWIGGDSAGVDGWALQVRADSKVFRRGPFVLGFTTSFRMGQLLRYGLQIPLHPPHIEVEQWMATAFIDAVRECLKGGGFAQKKDEQETGGTFLVGYRSHLFAVHDDYQVGQAIDGYDAIGSGAQIRPRCALRYCGSGSATAHRSPFRPLSG